MRLCVHCAACLIIPLHVHSRLWGKCYHCEDTRNTYEIKGPYESDVERSKANDQQSAGQSLQDDSG